MIISVFNFVWFAVFAIGIVYIVLTTKHLKNKTEEEKLDFIFKQTLVLCIGWILYKVGIYLDKEYIYFDFWNELPLYPCNTMIWIALIACRKKDKAIMAYSFYCGVLFAFLAMLMPSAGMYDINFFSARGLGYYLTHLLVIITGIQFGVLGLFEINFKSCLKAGLCFLILALIMHIINIILRLTVYPDATYYYTFGDKDNNVLKMIRSFIPFDFFYLIPLTGIGILIFMLETLVINSIRLLTGTQKARS